MSVPYVMSTAGPRVLDFTVHDFEPRNAPPILTILAKPPAHVVKAIGKGLPAPVVREAHVYAGWSHQGRARINKRIHSVWQKNDAWTLTLGARPPEGETPLYDSLQTLLTSTGADQYKGSATRRR